MSPGLPATDLSKFREGARTVEQGADTAYGLHFSQVEVQMEAHSETEQTILSSLKPETKHVNDSFS